MSTKRRKTGVGTANVVKDNATSTSIAGTSSTAGAVNGAAVANGAVLTSGVTDQDISQGETKANGKDLSTYEDGIAAELADQIERVQNGTFPKVATAQAALYRELERKIAIADRYRKLQIRNIEDLYAAEVTELKARFEVSVLSVAFNFEISKTLMHFG